MNKKSKILNIWRIIITLLLIAVQVAGMIFLSYYLSRIYTWVRFAFNVMAILLFFYIVSMDSPSSFMLPWVAVMAIAPILGTTVYLLFGRSLTQRIVAKKFKRTERMAFLDDSYLSKKYPEFGLSENFTNCKLRKNSHVTYLKNGEIFYLMLKEKLWQAKKYIFMEYFIIDEGEMWNGILEILKNKIKEGVKVYVIFDSFGCMAKMPRQNIKAIRDCGITFLEFNKFSPFVDMIQNNRDHRKLTVIDGKYGFMGGTNIADEYINLKHPFGHWIDNNVMVEGDAVLNMIQIFVNQYNVMVSSKEKLIIDNFANEENTKIVNDELVLPFGVDPGYPFEMRAAEGIYLDMIYNAKKTLYISTPYFVVDSYITDAIINAKKKGVDVKMMFPGIPDKKVVNIILRSNYQKLVDAGVKVYEYTPGFIHSKSVYADDMALVGTMNFDYRSLDLQFECGVLMEGSDAIRDMYQDFNDLAKNDCREIGPGDHHLNLFEKSLRNILKAFYPIL